jgi:hypothetical protein
MTNQQVHKSCINIFITFIKNTNPIIQRVTLVTKLSKIKSTHGHHIPVSQMTLVTKLIVQQVLAPSFSWCQEHEWIPWVARICPCPVDHIRNKHHLLKQIKKVKKGLYICVKLEEIKQQFICAANVVYNNLRIYYLNTPTSCILWTTL